MGWRDRVDASYPVAPGALEDEQLFLPDGDPVEGQPAPGAAPGTAPVAGPPQADAALAKPEPLPASGEPVAAGPEPAVAVLPPAAAQLAPEVPGPGPSADPAPAETAEVVSLFGDEPGDWLRSSGIELPTGRILAVVNQKGGVGKTTSTISLGAALALEGARVLLVDFDPQGALSVGLGLNPNALELTIYNLLLDSSVGFAEVVQPGRIEGLELLPANIDLAGAELLLVSEVAREQALQRVLAPVRERYHYILIDCPPSLGLLTINALTAADAVLIPLECEYFALRGMALLMDTIRKIQERINPGLGVEGILATMLDGRTIHGREVLSRVTDAFGDKLFKTIIHKTIKFSEAPVVGESILTYAPKSNGAQEYRSLAREVMSR